MGIISGGGGGTTSTQVAASGKVLPVADTAGVTVDTTTYDDPIGTGKLTTLVFPADQGALAIAIAGDTYPRWLMGAEADNSGLNFGRGSSPVYADAASASIWKSGGGTLTLEVGVSPTFGVLRMRGRVNLIRPAADVADAPQLQQVSPLFTISSGALPTVALVSGAGAQISVDRDVETVTPVTGDGTNNAATCAIALSPDNLTYSTLDTLSIAAAVNLTGALALSANIRVPAGWYLKLTSSHATIGTTTYY